MHDARTEDSSAAIQHWLREQEKGLASIPTQEACKGKTPPSKHHPKQLLNSPARAPTAEPQTARWQGSAENATGNSLTDVATQLLIGARGVVV